MKGQVGGVPSGGGSVPAQHRCAACDCDVDMNARDPHVCVWDESKKEWVPSTAKAAHKARLDREKAAKDKDRAVG